MIIIIMEVKKIDNIKIVNDKNIVIIKKGIIKKKYLVLFLILHFPILPFLFAILKNLGIFENHELRKPRLSCCASRSIRPQAT